MVQICAAYPSILMLMQHSLSRIPSTSVVRSGTEVAKLNSILHIMFCSCTLLNGILLSPVVLFYIPSACISTSIVSSFEDLPPMISNYMAGILSLGVRPIAFLLSQIWSRMVPTCAPKYFSLIKASISVILSLFAGANMNVLEV